MPVKKKQSAPERKQSLAEAWAKSGRRKGIAGDYQGALKDLNRSIRANPRYADSRTWRSEIWRRLGKSRKAWVDLNTAIRIDPKYYLAYTWRGRLRLNQGHYRLAIADFNKSIRIDPSDHRTQAWRAAAYWKTGLCRDAALAFDALFPVEPYHTWNRGRDGDERERHHRDSWKSPDDVFWKDLDAVVTARSDDPWGWAFRGRCRLACGRLRDGLADMIRALQINPDLAYAYKWKGEYLRRHGAFRSAAEDLERAIALDSSDPWSVAFRARLRTQIGDAAGAEADFSRVLDRPQRRFASVYRWRSEWLREQGRIVPARRDLEISEALEAQPSHVEKSTERAKPTPSRHEDDDNGTIGLIRGYSRD